MYSKHVIVCNSVLYSFFILVVWTITSRWLIWILSPLWSISLVYFRLSLFRFISLRTYLLLLALRLPWTIAVKILQVANCWYHLMILQKCWAKGDTLCVVYNVKYQNFPPILIVYHANQCDHAHLQYLHWMQSQLCLHKMCSSLFLAYKKYIMCIQITLFDIRYNQKEMQMTI